MKESDREVFRLITLLVFVLIGLSIWIVFKGKSSTIKTTAPSQAFNQTSNDLVGWETYINEKSGYQLKYPKEWYVLTEGLGKNIIAISSFNIRKTTKRAPNDIRIDIQTTKLNTPFSSYIKSLPDTSAEISREKIIVGGAEGIIRRIEGPGATRVVILPANGNVYTIVAEEKTSKQKTFNQILSTFKFLDSEDNQESVEGRFCGGIAANLPKFQCPPGYSCQLDGNYPDAGGTCQKNNRLEL